MASGTGNLPNQGMSFSPFAILTAEEMNDLVENIESLADGTGIGDGSVTTNTLAQSAALGNLDPDAIGGPFLEIGRTTLSSAGDTITVSGLPARKYLRVIVSVIPSGAIDGLMTFNGDTANNYAIRIATDGAADTTSTSRGNWSLFPLTTAVREFSVIDIDNIANQEKIGIALSMSPNTAGAGTAPVRREHYGKWVNTSNQISSITLSNGGAGDYAIGSEMIVLGHD